jgi:hypothetical protein
MLLPVPNLDDRRWSDLVEEGRNLIPRYAPEWTDFNVHDPGITLVELLAWVTEMDVFRLDRIPESHRKKFLALLGIAPWPPQAAQTVVQFSVRQDVNALKLPATTEVETEHPPGNSLRFRTLEELAAVPAELRALWRQDERGWHDLTPLWQNREPLPMFGDIPAVGSAFYFGFSERLPEHETVTLYLRFANSKSGSDERRRLQEEWLAARQDCPPSLNPCWPESAAPPAVAPCDLLHHSVRTVWEFAEATSDGNTSWRPLDPETGAVLDDTRACTLDGFVRFTLPRPMTTTALVPSGPPLHYLRCHLVAGEYDTPPILETAILNAAPAEQAVPNGTEFTIARGATISGIAPVAGSPAKFTLRFDAGGAIAELAFLTVEHTAPEFLITRWQAPTGTAPGLFGSELRLVGVGLGEPWQEVKLEPGPVQSPGVEIYTLERGARVEEDVWRAWDCRPDLNASSRSDRHFHLDETTGRVTFGDGEKGLPVPRDALIFATFRSTRAGRGNLPAALAWDVSDSAHNRALFDVAEARAQLKGISNPSPATGGAEAEDLDHAEGRALQEVRRVTRAVTIPDIEHLALTTPGTYLARVAAKANVDARYPCLQAPGMITVILLPQIPAPGAQPSSGLRAAVGRYLHRRRIIGSRIQVVGPDYTQVTVRARVQRRTGADAARVRQDVLQALHDFFDPLHGGPERAGWPFGRDVYRSEVLHVMDGVAGVENVLTLALIADDGEPSCGNLCLGPCGLVVSGGHEIVVD